MRALVVTARDLCVSSCDAVLRRRGHDVDTASEIAAVDPGTFAELDFAIVDAEVVGWTAEWLPRLRAHAGGERPIVAVLADSDDADEIGEWADSGVCEVLAAPVTQAAILGLTLSLEHRVHERARARMLAGQSAEAVMATRARAETILNVLPDLIFRLSRDGKFLELHADDPRMLFAPPSEVLGTHFRDIVPAALARRTEAAITRAFETTSAQVIEYEAITTLGERQYEARVIPINPDEVLVIVRDITERKELASQHAMADRLATLGTLVAGMAHEINNPLTYVVVGVDAVLRDLKERSEGDPLGTRLPLIRQRLGNALTGAKRVRQIVAELKAFTGAEVAVQEHLDVPSLLDSVTAAVDAELRARATLVREDGQVPLVRGNGDLLSQVFYQLLVNAIQAIPSAEPNRHLIRITTRGEDDQAVVEIADSGYGIPPELRNRIFDPFFTTKPVGVGTGLGLWMAHTIVSRYGGSLSVDSEPAQGAVFTVRLPGSPLTLSDQDISSGAVALSPGATVLVVEGDEGERRQVAQALAGFDLVSCNRMAQAVQVLESGHLFDVVLCALSLPDGTGIELYERVRAQRPGQEQRFVFMTNDPSVPSAREFLARVPNACMTRPVTIQQLESALRARRAGRPASS